MAVSPKEDLEILLEAGNLLAAKLDLSELLTTIMKLAARIVDAETGSLFLVDERTQELYFHVALGLPPEVAKIRLKMGQGIVGVTAQEGKPQIVNDVSKDPRWSKKVDKDSGFVTRSILAVPVVLKGRLIGVVEAINKIEGIFTPRDVRIFEAFAAQAAVAIDNARLFASLSEEKAKLSTLFDEMTDAAVLCDGEGKVLLANGAARKFFPGGGGEGFSLEEAFAGLDVSPSLVSVLHAP
ncbi:MAG: GAF domain-containing protein, partial [Elusimicrobiota bacterium]